MEQMITDLWRSLHLDVDEIKDKVDFELQKLRRERFLGASFAALQIEHMNRKLFNLKTEYDIKLE